MRRYGKCHECGGKLRLVLGDEEWCDACGQYRRYMSHGWGEADEGSWDCPKSDPVFSGGWAMAWNEPERSYVGDDFMTFTWDLYLSSIMLAEMEMDDNGERTEENDVDFEGDTNVITCRERRMK